jgi:hypothetical protein
MRLGHKSWEEIAKSLKEPLGFEPGVSTVYGFFKRATERERKGKQKLPLGFEPQIHSEGPPEVSTAQAPIQPVERPEHPPERAPKSAMKQPTDGPDLSVEPEMKSPWGQKNHN